MEFPVKILVLMVIALAVLFISLLIANQVGGESIDFIGWLADALQSGKGFGR